MCGNADSDLPHYTTTNYKRLPATNSKDLATSSYLIAVSVKGYPWFSVGQFVSYKHWRSSWPDLESKVGISAEVLCEGRNTYGQFDHKHRVWNVNTK